MGTGRRRIRPTATVLDTQLAWALFVVTCEALGLLHNVNRSLRVPRFAGEFTATALENSCLLRPLGAKGPSPAAMLLDDGFRHRI